jgi:hypothetical protein
MEKRIDDIEKSVKILAHHMKKELDELKKIHETKFDPDGSVTQRLRELEKEVMHQKKLTEALRDVVEEDTELEIEADKLQERKFEYFDEKQVSGLAELQADEKKKLDILSRKLEKELDELDTSEKKDLEQVRKEEQKKINTVNRKLFSGIHKVEKGQGKKLVELQEKVTNELEEDDVLMASNLKKIMDMKNKLNEMEFTMDKIEEFQRERDRKIEDIVMSQTTKHLGEFAKMIDQKFPELMTKEEFRKLEDEVMKRIDIIEAPDLSHIEKKVDVLERQVSQLVTMIRDVYNKLPAVVE